MAAYLLVLAGTDEGGCSADLETAAMVLQAARRDPSVHQTHTAG
jgi:hypothetical protein